jgi:hypothetical protein
MQRTLWIAAFITLAAPSCTNAQDSCTFKPGTNTITVDLRSKTKSFEPACQPLRIRVPDKTPVTLEVRNLSPVEVCSVSSKAPIVTPVTNPLESIINTITGLKGFSLAGSTPKMNLMSETLQLHIDALPGPAFTTDPDTDAQTTFKTLATEVHTLAQHVGNKQTQWQTTYQDDVTRTVNYLADDYRGIEWKKFNPDKGLANVHKNAQVTIPKTLADLKVIQMNDTPSEVDYAQIQSDIDQMKTIQSRFASRCSTTPPPAAAPKLGEPKPAPGCDLDILASQTSTLDQATAMLTVVQDNFKTLQAAQTVLTSSFVALEKVYTDFLDRKDKRKVVEEDDSTHVLYQKISLPFDYGATDTGTLSCSTDTSPAVGTTDSISYTILYQNVPALTVSAGLMVTFLQKNIYGQASLFDGPTSITTTNPNGTYSSYFRLTDSARASVFPMAYVNYRLGSPTLKTWWGNKNNEMIFTSNVSAGLGVNSNTGTNQPEFFTGYAAGFSRVLLHVGAHFGRTEALGGGYTVDTKVPSGFTSSTPVPIVWSYHPALGIGLSVRIAPF